MPCSIIIPTMDRPIGLVSAVRSAIAALPAGGEIVVVDDGSKIPASEVLALLARPELRVVANPGPHGPSGARNHGVAQSRQPVIFFLDDDDTLMPGYCRHILDLVPDLPEANGYGFSAAMIKGANRPDTYRGKALPSGVLGPETPLDQRLSGLGTGFWIRRGLFDTVGGLDPELRVNEDTEFSLRLSAAGILPYYCAEPGVLITPDPVRAPDDRGSITRGSDAAYRYRAFEHILRKHDGFLQDHADFRRRFMMRVIKYRSRARMLEGWDNFCRSLHPSPENRLIWAYGWIWLRLSIALRKLMG